MVKCVTEVTQRLDVDVDVENRYTISFFLPKTKTLSLALPTSNSSLYCTQELKPLDITYDQIFCKDIRKTLKYVDEFPE